MKKHEAPKIKTERLVLRRRKEEDIPFMVKMFNTKEVRQYLGGYPPKEERSMLGIIRRRNEIQWSVTLNNNFIGEVALINVTDNYLGELGYIFMKEYWGKGYAYEAVNKIIDYSFNTLKLKRLCASIDNRNIRSKKFIEKLGFEYITLMPESNFGGRIADVAYYSKKYIK
jgi:ribosomal-protein-alanine N-acetyltransferase